MMVILVTVGQMSCHAALQTTLILRLFAKKTVTEKNGLGKVSLRSTLFPYFVAKCCQKTVFESVMLYLWNAPLISFIGVYLRHHLNCILVLHLETRAYQNYCVPLKFSTLSTMYM